MPWALLVAPWPVCSGPRANSHQLLRCTLLKPVHTYLATLMDWPVLTFSQHLRVRVVVRPHLEHMSPGVWIKSSSAGTHNEVLSSLSKVSSRWILTSYKNAELSLAIALLRRDRLMFLHNFVSLCLLWVLCCIPVKTLIETYLDDICKMACWGRYADFSVCFTGLLTVKSPV